MGRSRSFKGSLLGSTEGPVERPCAGMAATLLEREANPDIRNAAGRCSAHQVAAITAVEVESPEDDSESGRNLTGTATEQVFTTFRTAAVVRISSLSKKIVRAR